MTTVNMDEKRAREIIGDCIEPDGGLYDSYWFIKWHPDDTEITIDTSCTVDQLEAIIFWMKLKGRNL